MTKQKAIFYHAGCPVCRDAEQMIKNYLNCEVEVVHLGQDRQRIDEARRLGVKSVPALVVNNAVYHINYGAGINDI
ncbi:MAG: thioredoxin family protein [Deltaproteobacteria bacterium]|nr:thioredoxin family protein [Deltaproteobacteria bacterium]